MIIDLLLQVFVGLVLLSGCLALLGGMAYGAVWLYKLIIDKLEY